MMHSGGTARPGTSDVKYAPGVGRRSHDHPPSLSLLELFTLSHVGIFAVATAWAFGGNADWVRVPLAWWGSLGVLITLAALQDRRCRESGSLRALRWLWPLLAFDAVVLFGTFNPGFRELISDGERLYIVKETRAAWPSAAIPVRALRGLWVFNAVWLACFNLVLVVRQRRALRALLIGLVANALVLSVFGTIQKLSGATGLFFGAVKSPQVHFFASFIYHNHWGAYVTLMLAAGIGLTWHYARRTVSRDVFHSPAFAGLTILALLAVTVPLSTSRSCTLVVMVLLCAACLHWIAVVVRKRRHYHESVMLPVAGAVICLLLVAAGAWLLGRETIVRRVDKTREQLAEMRASGTVGARAVLYGDTWRMAQAKPWFGWGMASYPHVFTLYNTRESIDGLPVYYHDAHSDWLQALAEHGYLGSALLAACAIVPLAGARWRDLRSTISRYLLAGCALILLYAWLEFPFGNLAVVLHWWLCFFAALQYARLPGHVQPAHV